MTDDGSGMQRASDAEREAAVATLRTAVGQGRITLEEFSDRVGGALVAVTDGDLARVVGDLPRPTDHAPVPAGPRATSWAVSILGRNRRRGRWRLGPRFRSVSLLGGNDLDLRTALLSNADTEIVMLSFLGRSEILLPPGIEVDVGGMALLGSNDLAVAPAADRSGGAVLRIRAYSLLGGVDIRRL